MNHRRQPLRVATLALVCMLLPGCLTERAVLTTQFPPDDFYLEVWATVTTADGLQHAQRFQVWRSGFTVYREADESLQVPGPEPFSLPVFSRVAAYEMAEESTRTLSRLLYTSGLADLEPVVGEPAPRGKVVSVLWRHLEDRRVQVHVPEPSAQVPDLVPERMARVLHVVNSFLPTGVRENDPFSLPLMPGDPEPAHLVDVPEVQDSAAGSLEFHLSLMERFPDDLEILLNAFALAHVQERRQLSTDIVDRIAVLDEAYAERLRVMLDGGPRRKR